MTKFNRFPFYGYVGMLLVAVFWYLNWHLDGLRSHWAFFPLWLGYILTINGLIHRAKGASLISKNFWGWVFLFVLSAPVWWLFEWLNAVARYWAYLGIESFTRLEYNIYCTINFSIVIPAIFGSAELVDAYLTRPLHFIHLRIGAKRTTRLILFLTGLAMLISFFIWPEYSPALLWVSLFLLFDPLNYWLGFRSILEDTAKGSWHTVVVLWIGGIFCGFLWELWNFYSWPKWIYDVPNLNFWHVFEMPLIGYLGYLPFALELYAIYHFILGLAGLKSPLLLSRDPSNRESDI